MFRWEALERDVEQGLEGCEIPTYYGRAKYRELFARYGVPNSAPRPGESHFGRCRVLFVDDAADGQPMAYWSPGEPEDFEGLGSFGDLSGFGVYTGSAGTWGVTTLKIGVDGRPYVRMFAGEREAIAYARDRVAKGPMLYYPRKPGADRPERNPKARVYYVVQTPHREYDPVTGDRALYLKHRVLRGRMGGVDKQEGVLVFDHAGRHGDQDRWKLNRSLSIATIDSERPTRARKPR